MVIVDRILAYSSTTCLGPKKRKRVVATRTIRLNQIKPSRKGVEKK
jgi:hypothetical protein